MKRVNIDRLDLHVKGIDAVTAEEAMRRLGNALAGNMAHSSTTHDTAATQEPLRVGVRPDAAQLSQAVASRVAAEVRAHLDRATTKGKES